MAGNRPRDWHVLDLDKDPTPGDPDRVRQLSKNLQDFADDVGDALRLIKGMADEEAVLQWAGKSAKAFQDQFSGVPKQLKKLKTSYDMAGGALAAYWPKLERAQALADRALANGRAAQADLSSAKSRLSSADSWVTRAWRKPTSTRTTRPAARAPRSPTRPPSGRRRGMRSMPSAPRRPPSRTSLRAERLGRGEEDGCGRPHYARGGGAGGQDQDRRGFGCGDP